MSEQIKTKTCSMCQVTKPVSGFYPHNRTRDGLQSNCIECQRKPAHLRQKRKPPAPTVDKYCRTCGERKPLSEFYEFSKSFDGLAYHCKSCAGARAKEYRQKKRAQGVKDFSYQRRWYRALKSQLRCEACGLETPELLHFHHRDPASKSFTIAAEIARRPLDEIKDEIRKCDVLCKDCHYKQHRGELRPYGKLRRFKSEVLEERFVYADYYGGAETLNEMDTQYR